MTYTLPRFIGMAMKHSGDKLLRPEFFEDRGSGVLGVDIRTSKPIIQFANHEVELRFNVGTRGNGTDAARWPEDLSVEVVD